MSTNNVPQCEENNNEFITLRRCDIEKARAEFQRARANLANAGIASARSQLTHIRAAQAEVRAIWDRDNPGLEPPDGMMAMASDNQYYLINPTAPSYTEQMLEAAIRAEDAANANNPKTFAPLDLHAADEPEDYIVEDCFSEQNCVIGGFMKTLKTTMSIYVGCCIACGCGIKLFNRWPVLKKKRVGIWSAESGGKTLKETVLRVLAHIGRRLDECDIFMYDTVPYFDDVASMKAFEDEVRDRSIEIAIVDPLSHALGRVGATNASNTMLTVQLIGEAEKAANRGGALLWVNDHTSMGAQKARENGRKGRIRLHDMAYGGPMKWARQWMLIERNTEYAHDGNHDLYIEIGGSAGHDQAFDVLISEGIRSKTSKRYFRVEVRVPESAESKETRIANAEAAIDQRVINSISEARGEGRSQRWVIDNVAGTERELKASIKRLKLSNRIIEGKALTGKGVSLVATCWQELMGR